ncbi:MAG: hypothetical protein SPK70_04085, partial [Succinivibrio dextrinosolvens]|nr:hypothetical protein [Succinivibrio dextrinosolvens]
FQACAESHGKELLNQWIRLRNSLVYHSVLFISELSSFAFRYSLILKAQNYGKLYTWFACPILRSPNFVLLLTFHEALLNLISHFMRHF